jgi:hypothetical protein
MDRILQSASGPCIVPKRYQPTATRVGGAFLQRATLDHDAARWAFRCIGRAGIIGGRYTHMVSRTSWRPVAACGKRFLHDPKDESLQITYSRNVQECSRQAFAEVALPILEKNRP